MDILQLQHLRKRYHSTYVLNDINLLVEEPQIIGYIGPNGAGKSTTIKILTGIIESFEGTAIVLGMDIRKEAVAIKRRIGYIPEQAALYEVLTPIEFLEFTGRLYQLPEDVIARKSWELLNLFGLADKGKTRMTGFSKGMKQKVLLVAGLIHNPEIVFLDEPLSGLDANAVILVKEILTRLRQAGKTLFYSSHIMDVVEKISDRIVIINDGGVIADGTFDQLKAQASGGSLESIFTTLTGNEKQLTTASTFVEILNS